jgi:hypothetical protein
MAQLTLKELLLSNTTGVPLVEPVKKDNILGIKGGIGKQITDVISADTSAGGPRMEFYKNLPSIYSTSLPIIESQGSIDLGRTLAVRSTHYNGGEGSLLRGGLKGVLGNLLGGSANRPSDTIFPAAIRDNTPPVSVNGQPINGDWSGLKYSVEAGVNYAVSVSPSGTNGLTGILKGTPEDIAKRAVGAATDAIKKGIRNLAVGALTSKRKSAANSLKDIADGYSNKREKLYNTYEKPGTQFYKSSGIDDMLGVQLMERVKGNINSANQILNTINGSDLIDTDGLQKLFDLNTKTNVQYIKFKIIGTKNYLVFPAAVGDITEDITTDIADFKYVGSPFKVYRYNGVERTLKFDFQVYWLDNGQQSIMERKLALLRQLTFPSSNLTSINIGKEGQNVYSPLVFSPNLIQLDIGDLYRNVQGIVSNLSIGVAQKTTWATSSPDFQGTAFVYPNVVDVSFEMKIIENHDVENETITYRFTKNEEYDYQKVMNKVPPMSSIGKNPGLGLPVITPSPTQTNNGSKFQGGKVTGWQGVIDKTHQISISYDDNGNPVSTTIPTGKDAFVKYEKTI